MISKEEFLNGISQTIIPKLKRQDEGRKQALLQALIIVLGGLIIGGIVLYFGLMSHTATKSFKDDELFKLIAIIVLGAFGIAKWRTQSFTNKIKDTTRTDILKLLDMQSNPAQEYMSLDTLVDINFFNDFNRKNIEDSFSSQSSPLFSVHELKLVKKREKNTTTVFQGPVLYYQSPKQYATPIMILKRNAVYTFGISKCDKVNWREVSLEDPEFNREYRIFAEDQVKARVILNPRFMEKLKDIKDTYNSSFRVLFFENYFVIAISLRKDMFEFYDVFRKPSIEKFGQFYDEIKVLTDLVETLEFK